MIHQLGAEAAGGAAAMVKEGGPDSQLGAMWAKTLARVEELQWKRVQNERIVNFGDRGAREDPPPAASPDEDKQEATPELPL